MQVAIDPAGALQGRAELVNVPPVPVTWSLLMLTTPAPEMFMVLPLRFSRLLMSSLVPRLVGEGEVVFSVRAA